MAEWVKLHAKIAESEDFAALQAADPNAALLFLMSLPIAAPWGILPRSAAVFRGRVAPMFDLSLSQVETCLRLVLDQCMYREYTDRDGKAHMYVTAWTQNQARQWDRVGPPPCDLPPAWEPPADIARAIAVSSKAKRWLTVETLEAHLQDAESKTRLRLVLDQSKTSLPKRGRGRGESPETPTTNDILPEPAIAVPAQSEPDTSEQPDQPAEPPAPKRSKRQRDADRKAKDEAALQTAIDAARADLPPELLPTLDAWLSNLASHNDSGTMTTGRALSETTQFANLVHAHGLTTAAIQHGVAAALEKSDRSDGRDGITSVVYVRKAALNFDPSAKPGGNGKAKPREEFLLTRWGKRYPASEWSPGEANHVAWMKADDNWDPETGRTLRPVPTFCCVDGFFYPGDGSERFEVAPV